MNMVSDAIAIVRECVSQLGQNIPITAIKEIAANKWRVYITPLWIAVEDVVNSDGIAYEVVEVGCDYVDVQGDTAPVDTISTAPVYFMHGTIKNVQYEMSGISNAESFTPLVYYIEASSVQLNFDPMAQSDSVNDARLLILKSCDVNSWLTADHYSNVLIPTEKITRELINQFQASLKLGELKTAGQGRASNYINVGNYNDKGPTANMFVFPMSGVELRINLPIRRVECEC